jgi:predicted transcriptional regulator
VAEKAHGGARTGAGRPPAAEPSTQTAVRLPDALLGRLDVYAAAVRTVRSEAMRALIDRALTLWERKSKRNAIDRDMEQFAALIDSTPPLNPCCGAGHDAELNDDDVVVLTCSKCGATVGFMALDLFEQLYQRDLSEITRG